MARNYNTKQRRQILDYLRSLEGSHTTAQQVVAYFSNLSNRIGSATVYRQLNRMYQEGLLHKFAAEGYTCYQLADGCGTQEHHHLKCEQCGKLTHLECDYLGKIGYHIQQEHGFTIDPRKTVFFGKCYECTMKEV